MKVNFCQTTWNSLASIADCIHNKKNMAPYASGTRLRVQNIMMVGLADAIDAEIKRAEMANEKGGGQVTLSINIKIESFENPPKYNLLAELDDILNKKNSNKNLLDW